MSHALHLASVWLHILAATVWIGGMAALGLLLVPLLRRERFQDVARPLLYASALRFRWIGDGPRPTDAHPQQRRTPEWPVEGDRVFLGGRSARP